MAACAARRSTGPVIRSISPSSRFNPHFYAQSPSSQSYPTPLYHLSNHTSPSLRISGSPSRSVSSSSTRAEKPAAAPHKRTCLCSPTNHPGSFRCSLHKGGSGYLRVPNNSQSVSCGGPGGLNMRRSAMKNSLVRIGTVEGNSLKRVLASLIRPSSHQQRRRGEFRRRPSRLSVMSKA